MNMLNYLCSEKVCNGFDAIQYLIVGMHKKNI